MFESLNVRDVAVYCITFENKRGTLLINTSINLSHHIIDEYLNRLS